MSLISNSHTVSIAAPPATLLGQIAAAMPTRSWVYMNGTTQYGIVCTKPLNFELWNSPQGGHFQWGNRFPWNPTMGTLESQSSGSHNDPLYQCRYRLADNTCDRLLIEVTDGGNHLFERVTANPFTGQIYQSINGFAAQCNRFNSGAHPPYTLLPATPHLSVLFSPTEWWRGSLTGAGSQGALVLAHNRADGQGYVDFYDPLSNTWFASTLIPQSTNDYNMVGAYSYTKNVFVFADRSSPSRVWKVSSDRTCIRMGNAPVNLDLYSNNFIADPITGNFIAHTNSRQLWEFNPDGSTGTWTLLPSAPNGGALGTVNVNGNGGNGAGVCCVQDLGVIVFVSQNWPAPSGIGMAMHVYKHG